MVIKVHKISTSINVFLQNSALAGLDTYFFLNSAVGQPSNNMDLSKIEIYLGIMIIFFLFREKIGENCISLYLISYFKINVKHTVT